MRVVFESELQHLHRALPRGRQTCILDLNLPCTLACPQCLRAPRNAPAQLDVARLVRRVEAAAGEKGVLVSRVVVHGGDPLLRPDALVCIGTAARAAAARHRGRFEGVVLTPGTLLDEPVARTLREAGFADVQVLLDFPPAEHDRAHPRRDGGGSFGAIVHALKFGRDRLRVVVRTAAEPGDPRVEALAERLRVEGLFAEPDPVVLLAARPAPYALQARQLLATIDLVAHERARRAPQRATRQ